MEMKKFNLEGDNLEELKKSAKIYADSVGIKLNPNEKVVTSILNRMLILKKEKGELYCPCRVVIGDKKKDDEIICPCVYHRGEIELDKKCHCNLFVENID